MELKDSLPVTENDFVELIDKNMIYDDKTDLVAKLAQERTFYSYQDPRGLENRCS